MFSIAATVLLVVASIFIIDSYQGKGSIGESMESVQSFAYLDENLDDLSIYDLIDNLNLEDLEYFDDIISEEELDLYFDENLDNLSEEEIKAYL